MKTINILKEGLAICVYEPRGDYGLEGYELDRGYHYQIKEKEGKKYYKVYPDKNDMVYGETCSKIAFNRHFKSVVEIDYKPLERNI